MSSFKRTLHYAGLSALGLGSKIFKGKKINRALKRSMASKMTGMKGIPLKINQILGMSEKESSELYKEAMDEIEPISFEDVKKLINDACPELLAGAILSKDFKCASLGQVGHISKDGLEYAVKVQYPDSETNMNFDGKAMDLMTSCFQNFSRGFDMQDYEQVLKDELAQELDYMHELEMQHEFYRIFSGNNNIVIPLCMKKHSNRNCLVMSWEPSLSMEDFIELATETQKKQASRLITEFYMTSVFENGLLHSDPNPGNFGFRIFGDKVQLVVYDFGSAVKLSENDHIALLSLFDLCINKHNPLPALVKLRFKKDLLVPVSEKLPALLAILLQPFLSEGVFDLSHWNRKDKAADILGDKRWNFMAAAPAELFLFMRTVFGLFYYTEKLSGEIFCNRFLKNSLNRFESKLAALREDYGDQFEQTVELSSYLIISVKENGMQKVKLTLPATAVENLKSFIPPDVEDKLKDKEICIESLVSNVRKNAYKPQTVFSLIDGIKEVEVFLE